MYVTIDCKENKFIHKTPDIETAANLAFIELRHNPYSVEPITAVSWLRGMSDGAMRMLYQNTTGRQTHYLGDFLRAILCELACRLPETDVNDYLAEQQASSLSDESPFGYEYVDNALKPALTNFVPEALTVEPHPNEAGVGAAGAHYYASAARPSAGTSGGTSGAHAATGSSTAPKPARAPRARTGASSTGQKGGIIWEVADKLWAEAGSPTDVPSLLSLRKEIMKVLESQHGVKKTTSSTALGGWQKTKTL